MGQTGRLVAIALSIACVGFCRPALAESVDVPLPFLADDASYPPGVPPRLIWPGRQRLSAAEQRFGWKPQEGLPGLAPAYPDVTQLLETVSGAVTDEEDGVRFAADAPDRARIERLLRAVRSGYSRKIGLSLKVTDGDQHLVELTRRTRAGALVLAADAHESVWPAALTSSGVLIAPRSMLVRGGVRVGAVVELLPDGRVIVDLDLHVSRVDGERAFEDAAVYRVAPSIDVIHLRAAIPLRDGESSVAVLGDVRVDVRVDLGAEHVGADLGADRQAVALMTPASRLPSAIRVRPRQLPLTFKRDLTWLERAPGEGLPAEWVAAAQSTGVRLVDVPPGLAIAEGAAEALALFSKQIAARTDVSAQIVRDEREGLEISVVGGCPFSFVRARLLPVTTDVEVEVQDRRASVATRLAFEAVGSFVHGSWEGDSLTLAWDTRQVGSDHTDEGTGALHEPPSTERGGAPTAFRLDSATFRSHSRIDANLSERAGDGETERGGGSGTSTPMEDWR